MTETAESPTTFDEVTAILRKTFPGYEERPQQTAMAHANERTLAAPIVEDQMPPTLAVQAGCGVGKSYALVIPAALHTIRTGERAVIATGTIALQNQIFSKDLPELAKLIPGFPTYALLKGRSNYACMAKISEDPEFAGLAALKKELADPDAIGDRENLTMQISAEDWRNLSATTAECPGKADCPFGDVCFAEKAKRVAAEAELVIANHATLGLDAALRWETDGAANLLGRFGVLLVDEADGLDSNLRGTMTTQLRLRGLQKLASMAQSFVQSMAENAEGRAADLKESTNLIQALAEVGAVLPRVVDPEKPEDLPEGGVLNLAWFAEHGEPFVKLVDALLALKARLEATKGDSPKEKARRILLVAQARNAAKNLRDAILAEDEDLVRYNTWSRHPKSAQLFWEIEFAPVNIAPLLRERLWSAERRVVLTSATLATGDGDFGFLTRTLGLEHAETLDVGTPFDYQKQALLFVPGPTCPAPSHKPQEKAIWQSYITATTQELVKASGGGALLLYTSRASMTATHAALAPVFEEWGLTVLIQDGETSNAELVKRFREDKNSVLFAVRSFFVGVDIPGDALRLVVVDKLPFPVFTDPVFAARSAAEERAHRFPFKSLSIPIMILILTQAFGRLIRSMNDRGVVAILDSRLTSKLDTWGGDIIAGLPDSPATVQIEEVRDFYAKAA